MPSINVARTSRDPCLEIRPRRVLRSDSRCLGVKPTPRAQVRRRREPGDVTDLGDQHRGADLADAVDRLHRPIATIVLEVLVDVALESR